MFISRDKSNEKNWNGYTLVVPCISVGNVGQLAADLIISTLWLDKAGYLCDDSILPVIGNDPFACGNPTKACRLMTAAEVFESAQHKLVVVQLRSSLVPSKRQQFLQKLQSWILSCGFSCVVMLTSSFAHERRDSQLEGTQLRYVPSSHFCETKAATLIRDNLKWRALEKRPSHPALRSPFIDGDGITSEEDAMESADEKKAREECSEVYIPGAGFAKGLLQKCIASSVPAVILLRFCAEGDNICDAVELATMLNSWLNWIDLKKSSQQIPEQQDGWRIPSSWRLQYGSHFQQMLFQ